MYQCSFFFWEDLVNSQCIHIENLIRLAFLLSLLNSGMTAEKNCSPYLRYCMWLPCQPLQRHISYHSTFDTLRVLFRDSSEGVSEINVIFRKLKMLQIEVDIKVAEYVELGWDGMGCHPCMCIRKDMSISIKRPNTKKRHRTSLSS